LFFFGDAKIEAIFELTKTSKEKKCNFFHVKFPLFC